MNEEEPTLDQIIELNRLKKMGAVQIKLKKWMLFLSLVLFLAIMIIPSYINPKRPSSTNSVQGITKGHLRLLLPLTLFFPGMGSEVRTISLYNKNHLCVVSRAYFFPLNPPSSSNSFVVDVPEAEMPSLMAHLADFPLLAIPYFSPSRSKDDPNGKKEDFEILY